MSTRRITIFDTTLRDGEQSPGIALQPDEKAEIAAQLERLGVDVIEAGFAISSPGDFEGVRAVAQAAERRDRRLARPHRARRRRRRRRGARRRAALAPPRLHRDEPDPHGAEAPARARRGARAGGRPRSRTRRGRVDEVEFSAEDATRSDPEFLAEVCREAIEAGATTTVNLPGHGRLLPAATSTRRSSAGVQRAAARSSDTRHALGALPQRPRPRGREHARRHRRRRRRRSSARSTGSASGPETPRSRRS